jgi:FdrA protein
MKSKTQELLDNGPVVVNIGIVEFAESLEEQGAEVVHVDWKPPAGGDEELAELLDRLI